MVSTSLPIVFQGKDPEEEFQFHFRQHWIRLLWPLTRMILVTLFIAGVGYAVFAFGGIDDSVRRATLLILGTFFILSQFEFLIRFYNYFLYIVIISDRRIHRIKKTLITTDEQQSIDLWVLQDINKSQHGIVQNIFGFGSITLEAQETILRIHFIPHISHCYQKLMRLREGVRMKIGTISPATKNQMPYNVPPPPAPPS